MRDEPLVDGSDHLVGQPLDVDQCLRGCELTGPRGYLPWLAG